MPSCHRTFITDASLVITENTHYCHLHDLGESVVLLKHGVVVEEYLFLGTYDAYYDAYCNGDHGCVS